VRPLDIAIAGCGPGGLAAALFLHRAGHRVTLFERFAEPRPLGSGLILQPTGLAILSLLGLGEAARDQGARIDRLFGRAVPSKRIVLDVRYDALAAAPFGIGIHRGTLFQLLYDAVLADGIPIQSNRTIEAADTAPTGRTLRFAGGDTAGPFDFVLDALGTLSPLAPGERRPLGYGALWTTLDWCGPFSQSALEQRYRRADKMVGVLPIGRIPGDERQKGAFFWSLRTDRYESWRNAGLAAWKEEALAFWPETAPLLGQIADPAQLTFARYCHRTYARPAEPALVHIGDAWHSTSPQLGQGANMALLDAAALATAFASEVTTTAALARYVRLRRNHVRLYQAISAVFTPFYQSGSRLLPYLRDHLAGPLSRVPPAPKLLAALVAGSIGNPLRHIAPASTGTTGEGPTT
jgi:2-polyprenyl-6-methoxyphenol hydroxylase-like FAD-dependent oxidoreductase